MRINKDELEYVVEGFITEYPEITKEGKYVVDQKFLDYVESYLNLSPKDIMNIKKYFSCELSEYREVVLGKSFSCILKVKGERVFVFVINNVDSEIVLVAKDRDHSNEIWGNDLRKYIGSEFKTVEI